MYWVMNGQEESVVGSFKKGNHKLGGWVRDLTGMLFHPGLISSLLVFLMLEVLKNISNFKIKLETTHEVLIAR